MAQPMKAQGGWPFASKEIAAASTRARRLRRLFHQYPEMAFEETKTAAVIRKELKAMGLKLHRPYLGTDVVADLMVPGAKKAVAWRADIDALPIAETGTPPWKSKRPGFMHACGHDGHMAIALGAAGVLSKVKKHLPANVRFIFQPAEEVKCGGEALAKTAALSGISAIYALHGWPGLPLGVVSTRPGVLFAAGFFYKITFTGKGTHGATPEKGVNPLTAAAHFAARVADLHPLWNKRSGAALSVCRLAGGFAANAIPDTASVEGTFRCLSPGEGPLLERELFAEAKGIAKALGARVKTTWHRGYRFPVINEKNSVDELVRASEHFSLALTPSMASEDFAHMLQKVPGAMAWLGLGRKQPGLHASCFDFPDEALAPGIQLVTHLMLGHGKS